MVYELTIDPDGRALEVVGLAVVVVVFALQLGFFRSSLITSAYGWPLIWLLEEYVAS